MRTPMKMVQIVLASIALLSASHAQEKDRTPSYALMFGVGPDLRLGNFNMDIAGELVLDETRSVRLLLSPEVRKWSRKTAGEEAFRTDEDSETYYSLTVACDYVWIVAKTRRFNLFAGTGLSLSYSHRNFRAYEVTMRGDIRHAEANNPQAWGGIRGILGAEWKVMRNIGVHVEYIPVASYLWRENKTDYKAGVAEPYASKWEQVTIDLMTPVLLGVSIYM